MSSNVAIEVVVVDDKFSAPGCKKIGRTIVVKVPPRASLEMMNHQIMERYPALRNSWNMYYFFDNNDLKTTQVDNLDRFWRHHETVTEGLCVLHVTAMLLKHPKKNCTHCGGGLYGRFFACQCGGFHSCQSCIDDEGAECSEHGEEFIWSEMVPIPLEITNQKYREFNREIEEHHRFWIRQQAIANGLEEPEFAEE